MTNNNGKNRVERAATLRWVPIGLMSVSPVAQRELVQSRVDQLAADFDLEQIGTPTVNHRDGKWFIIDGQHRVEALRAIGWGDQQIQCWAYEGLAEAEEAETYLRLNNVLAQKAFDKFRISVVAGRPAECEIERIVRAQGMVISRDRLDNAVSCVGTLQRIFHRSGNKTLARTLRIAFDAYGAFGLEADLLDGIGLLCGRYNGDLEDQLAVTKLHNVSGGANGLRQKAEIVKRSTGLARNQSIAAAAVEVINAGRGGKKLPTWFHEDVA